MAVKPVTPKEAKENKYIPDAVIEAFNTLITANLKGNIAHFTQSEVVKIVLSKTNYSRDDLFNNGWMDVEPLFEKAGWDVRYDKPGYNESYPATFTFKAKP